MSRSQGRKQALDDALDVVSDLLKIAAVVSDTVSVPALRPVVSILSELIQRVKDTRTNTESEAVFFEKTKTLGEVIRKKVEEANAAPGGGNSVLQEQVITLSSALGKIQEMADGLRGGEGFRGSCKRLLSVTRNQETLDKMNKQLMTAQEMFITEVQLATQTAVGRIEQVVINAEERKVIDNIPHADAGYLSVKEMKSGFMQGTRNDTFGTLKAWTGADDSAHIREPVFLLTAGAGLGKSAVAHQLCVRLSDPKQLGLNLGASFFFSRGGIDSAYTLFSTIARQLALTQPRIRPVLVDAAQRFLDGGKEQQARRTFDELLLKPLTEHSDDAVFNETTFIIIDGLDECKDRELIPELLRCLLELVRGVPWIRVFLATRPEPHILSVLIPAVDIVHHQRLDDPQTINESKESVELYLRQTIPEIHPYGDFVRAHPDMLDRLVNRANGLFIYARVAVNYLEMYDTHPDERLALLLESKDVRLSPLDKLYLQVLQSAFPSHNLAEWPAMHKRFHDFLTFIALHLKPLPPAAISLLLMLTEDDVLWMAGRLRAVLLINKAGDLVPLHATFSEFLLDSKRCIDALYHIDKPQGSAFLVCRCLAAFDYDMATLYLRSMSDSKTGSPDSFDGGIMLPRRLYSTIWDRHLHAARSSDELQQRLQGLLQMQPIMDPAEAAAICTKHMNMRFYCELWWRKMAGDYTASQAASVTIAELESKWESDVKRQELEDSVYSKFSIQTQDITRYTTILQALVDKIRDSGTGEMWYNLAIGDRRWHPM